MRIVDIGPKPGRVWELEVSNLIGRRRLVRRLGAIPGLRILQGPKWLSMFREEVFCRFEFGERCFVAEAGETGGYRIRPERPGCVPELLAVRDALRDDPRQRPLTDRSAA
jgi:hypothetical protein